MPFDAAAVALVFGVALDAFFGHTSAVLCGSLVLDRDPGGRSISRGCAAATATSIVIFCVCVLAFNGAVGADDLTGVTGTVIGPLAEVGGTVIAILGFVFVVLTLGTASIFESLYLSELVRERIPTSTPRVVGASRDAVPTSSFASGGTGSGPGSPTSDRRRAAPASRSTSNATVLSSTRTSSCRAAATS